MKEQELRRYKQSLTKTSEADLDQLKARTVIALDKLGHQKFFDEPGGYSLENWMKGVNLLLDDFEKRMGAAKLPPEYAERRRELTERLSKPVDVSSIDKDVSELKQKEEGVIRRFGEERARTASKIDELKGELAKSSIELEEEKRRLSSAVVKQNHRSLLGRLLQGGSTPDVVSSESKVEELETRISAMRDDVLKEQKHLKSVDQHSEPPWDEEWAKLESLRAALKELEEERLAMLQHVREREETAASIASAISGVPTNNAEGKGQSSASG